MAEAKFTDRAALEALREIAAPIPPEFVQDGSADRGRMNHAYKARAFDRAQRLACQVLHRAHLEEK